MQKKANIFKFDKHANKGRKYYLKKKHAKKEMQKKGCKKR